MIWYNTCFLFIEKVKPICLPFTADLKNIIPAKLDVVYKPQDELNSDKAPLIQTVSTHPLSECILLFHKSFDKTLCASKFSTVAIKKIVIILKYYLWFCRWLSEWPGKFWCTRSSCCQPQWPENIHVVCITMFRITIVWVDWKSTSYLY